MSKQRKEITVKDSSGQDKVYSIGRFGVDSGIEMTFRLNDLILPIISALDDSGKVDDNKATEAFVRSISSVDAKTRAKIIKDLMTVVYYKNAPILEVYETHFVGEINLLFKICKEVISHNGFLGSGQDMLQMFTPPPAV